MARIYGHGKSTADRLTEIAKAPQDVGRAFLRPQRQPRMLGGGGSGQLVYCETPVNGIAAMTKSGSTYSFGEATCTVVDGSGTLTAETIVVRNSVAELIPGEILIGAVPLRDSSGKYGIVVGNCDQSGSS